MSANDTIGVPVHQAEETMPNKIDVDSSVSTQKTRSVGGANDQPKVC